jgi:protein arginine kinase activator
MICQKCKKAPAVVCISQVANNKKTDTYLCQDCANETATAGLKAALGLFGMQPGHFIFADELEQRRKMQTDAPCPTCGKTFEEIRKDGKMGCADCYQAFRDKIRPIVARIHGNTQHKGSCPARTPDEYRHARRLDELKAALDAAVKNEEYEKAAQIRDHIKGMEVSRHE